MEKMTLSQKLATAQSDLKAPKVQYNNFGKYHYRSADDILEAVKPINKTYGLTLYISDEVVEISGRFYVRATATVTDGITSLSVTAFAREAESKKGMDESQVTGTASSYARKYALNGLYLIDDTKDADTDEHAQQVQQSQKINNENSDQQRNEPTKEEVLKALKKISMVLKEYYGYDDQSIRKYVEKVCGKSIKEIDVREVYKVVKKLSQEEEKKRG